MYDEQYFDKYTTLLESKPELYTGIEIHGVKSGSDSDSSDIFLEIDDENPQFFSAYARDIENGMHCVADAGMSKLDDLRVLAKELASKYNWEYQDFTIDKQYLACGQCKAKVTTLFGEGCCVQCFESNNRQHYRQLLACETYLPVGTRIISIKGETSDTDVAHDVFTGENVEGVITQVLAEQEHCYLVEFPLDVSVFISQSELADSSNYRVVEIYATGEL